MQKKVLFLSCVVAIWATACSPKSEKGKWVEQDKDAFKKECLEAYDKAKPEELELMKHLGISDKADYTQSCECMLRNAEPMYLPQEIIGNQEEQKKVGIKCLGEIVGEKGAWKPKFKDFLKEALNKAVDNVVKEAEEEQKSLMKSLFECSVDKVEKEISPVELMQNYKNLDGTIDKAMQECGAELQVAMEFLKAIVEQNVAVE